MTHNKRKNPRKIFSVAVLKTKSMRTDGFDEPTATRDDRNTTTSESFKSHNPERFFPPRWDDKKALLVQGFSDRRWSESTRELYLAIKPPRCNQIFELRPLLAVPN